MMYDYPCEFCDGHVRDRILDNEVIRVPKSGFAILQQVPVGLCDKCGMRYYHASVLKQAEEVCKNGGTSTRAVPVATYRAS